jgi:hypothetical protein
MKLPPQTTSWTNFQEKAGLQYHVGVNRSEKVKKTRHPNRLVFQAKPGQENTVLNWRNQSDQEFGLFAESFHRAAKTLVKNLDLDRGGD